MRSARRRLRPAPREIATLLAVVTLACRDSLPPGSPEGNLRLLTLSYVCGNDFVLENQGSLPLTVGYAVLGTSEKGELIVPPLVAASGNATRLTTLQRGAVQISQGEETLAPVENGGTACPPPVSAPQPQATMGEWSAPFSWPVVAVHLHLLPTGLVLSWGREGSPQLWDPATGQFAEVPVTTMIFCSGHAFLPDGRLLVTGGHLDDQRGLPDANIFSPASQAWTPTQPMSRGRWYPTSTTLASGEILTLGGTDEEGKQVSVPEVWAEGSWRALPQASRTLPYYPRTFVAPNGLVFYAGELPQAAYLDPTGAGTWTPVAASNYGRRDYGSAVMYQPGKVMILGGSDPPDGIPTNTAELIDLTRPSPSWRYTSPMIHARRHLNATLLPDGEVLVTGGTSAGGFSDPSGAVHEAEAWNPETQRWRRLASGAINRVYHSTTLLLPDGRVLHTGSGDGPGLPRELNAEIYSPPYLFQGTRPLIESAPDAISYGQQFFVATSDAGTVTRVTLVRLSSVTHAFDQSQRFVELSFRKTAGGLTVTGPGSGAVAPPGPYLIFILTAAGVPSAGTMTRVG